VSTGIVAENLDKRFGSFQAVKGVSFEALEGKITALLGPSGSGKSTVLRMIAGLERPDAGRIWVDGEEQTNKSPQERRLGFVFQHYALFRHMTVRQNVTFGLSVRKVSKADQTKRVDDLLKLVGLEAFTDRYPDQLSGGQRQRVALARALAPRPKVLLLDEPFGALDARVRQELRRWLDELHRELGVTSLLVTHDQEEALELANEVVVMRQGEVEQIGAPDRIYNEPATPFVAGFIGAANVIRGRVVDGRVSFGDQSIEGADHLAEGESVHAYVRPHDVRISKEPGEMTSPVVVERVTNLGWMSKVRLRLPDGQPLLAHLTNEEMPQLAAGQPAFVDLRNAKVFTEREASPAHAEELAGV
jgi:sulfate transport system ATP-binding protein